jgi:hypothetical protein
MFRQVDPLWEKYPGWGPYNYCKNDPLNRFDPDGREPWEFAREYGTNGSGLTPNITNIEETVDRIHQTYANRDAIVTYTTNGRHSERSLHYSGNAIDLRTRDLTREQIAAIVEQLREELGDDYDVIFEGDHIHIEYDPSDNQNQNQDEQNNQQNQDEQNNQQNQNNSIEQPNVEDVHN